MLKAQQPSASGVKFDLEADGGTLKLHVSIPEEELRKAIQTETTTLSQMAGLTSAPAHTPAVPPAASAPYKGAAKAAAAEAVDNEGNTVVVRLPGKK